MSKYKRWSPVLFESRVGAEYEMQEQCDGGYVEYKDWERDHAENERLREALEWYPFGGLSGLLKEIEQTLKSQGAACLDPENCGSLGCLLAKLYFARKAIDAALASEPQIQTVGKYSEVLRAIGAHISESNPDYAWIIKMICDALPQGSLAKRKGGAR